MKEVIVINHAKPLGCFTVLVAGMLLGLLALVFVTFTYTGKLIKDFRHERFTLKDKKYSQVIIVYEFDQSIKQSIPESCERIKSFIDDPDAGEWCDVSQLNLMGIAPIKYIVKIGPFFTPCYEVFHGPNSFEQLENWLKKYEYKQLKESSDLRSIEKKGSKIVLRIYYTKNGIPREYINGDTIDLGGGLYTSNYTKQDKEEIRNFVKFWEGKNEFQK